MSQPPDLSKFLPAEEVYRDLLKPSAQELGEAAKNIIKTARFLLAPIDYLATLQDRFQEYLKRVSDKVPTENLSPAPSQIVGKSFEGLRYLEPESILTEMYIKLLATSIDKEKCTLAHPSFPLLIENMCRDEAIIIYFLSKNNYRLVQYSKFDQSKNLFYGRDTRLNTFPLDKLDNPNSFFMYMDHLHSLNIAGIWQDGNQTPDVRNGVQVGVTINSNIILQEFGILFAKACAVDDIERFGVHI